MRSTSRMVLLATAALLTGRAAAQNHKEHDTGNGMISHCKIGHVFPCKTKHCGGAATAHILDKCTIPDTCHTLRMWSSDIGDEGALAMARELDDGGAKELRELDLRFNKISDVGMIALAKAMQKHPNKISFLALRGNTFGDAAAAELAKVIETAPLLHSIHLEHNKITPEGGKLLAKALEGNVRMEYFNVHKNVPGVGEEVEASVAESLAWNKVAAYGRHSHDEV